MNSDLCVASGGISPARLRSFAERVRALRREINIEPYDDFIKIVEKSDKEIRFLLVSNDEAMELAKSLNSHFAQRVRKSRVGAQRTET